MKMNVLMAAMGLLAWQASATTIPHGASLPGAAGLATQALAPEYFDSTRGTFVSLRSGLDGHVQMTTSLPNNTLLSVVFTVGVGFLLDGTIPGAMPLTPSNKLSVLALGDPSLAPTRIALPEGRITTDLSAWEGRGSVVLTENMNRSATFAKSGVVSLAVSAAGTKPTLTNGDTADAVRAMPEGPLPWWASLSGMGVVFWLAARREKLRVRLLQ